MDLILMKSRSKVVLASALGTGTKPGPFSKIANVALQAPLVHGNALISVVFFLVAYATEECCSDPATTGRRGAPDPELCNRPFR
jgi:hypothetical protein